MSNQHTKSSAPMDSTNTNTSAAHTAALAQDKETNATSATTSPETLIRCMRLEDYEGVSKLWHSIQGFGIRSIDDSRDGVAIFLRRNPTTSVVAIRGGKVVGSILCGHDGRRGTFYHVCVDASCRNQGIGHDMARFAMRALQAEGINKVSLIAFKSNAIGNAFWQGAGWTERTDLNYYDYTLNEANITNFVK